MNDCDGFEQLSYLYQLLFLLKKQRNKSSILTNNKSISQIAYIVGYNTYSHFCILFKKNTGVSPTVYKEKFSKIR